MGEVVEESVIAVMEGGELGLPEGDEVVQGDGRCGAQGQVLLGQGAVRQPEEVVVQRVCWGEGGG